VYKRQTTHGAACTIRSREFDGPATRPIQGGWTPAPGHWSNYPFGVLEILKQEGLTPPAFAATFESTLPPGAGLSSSAALEVSTALFLLATCGLTWEPLRIARACRRAENIYAGVNCGLLDQLTSVAGKKEHLISIDFRDETHTTIPFPKDFCFLVFASGVPHSLVVGEYNERRDQCYDAATRLGLPSLREASTETVKANRTSLPELSYRRALHITGENERVLEAIKALSSGSPERLGTLMLASHESSRLNFENSTPYLDLLVEIAVATPGVLGARLTGGGFGGSIVALCKADHAKDATQTIEKAYAAQSGYATYGLTLTPWHGAHLIS
jgi:galactokinase